MKFPQDQDNIINIITNLIIAVFAFALVVYVLNYIESKPAQSHAVIIEPQPSEYPDFDAIKGESPDFKIKSAIITKDCQEDGCVNHEPATVDFGSIAKNYEIKGEFSRAYLFIEALVDYGKPLTVWDDFYFTMSNLGGHLIPNHNILPVPPGNSSRYLYDLRSLSYYPRIEDKENKENRHNNINLFYLLQNNITLGIEVSISSDRPGRIMREVAIYYECFKGSECSIEEIK